MEEESTITSTDEDHDSDYIENLNDLFQEFEIENESVSSYKSEIKIRDHIIRQSRISGLSGADIITRIYQNFQKNSSFIKLTDLSKFNQIRKQEKNDLIRLNDNLAQYIQAIRFLEIENKNLNVQNDTIQNSMQQNSLRIKNIYETEITQANKILNQVQNENSFNTNHIEQIQNNIKNEQNLTEEFYHTHQINLNQIELIRKTISQNDADIILFRRRLSDIEDEIYRYKIESSRICSLIKDIQIKIEEQIFLKIIFQTEKNSVEDQIKSLLLTHETVINEIQSKYFSIHIDSSKIFHNEFSEKIKELRQEYDEYIQQKKDFLHNQYLILYNKEKFNSNSIQFNKKNYEEEKKILNDNILKIKNKNIYLKAINQQLINKINFIQTSINHLQDKNIQTSNEQLEQIKKCRHNLEQLELTYQQIISFKNSLENEINIYRQLLQGRHGLKVHIDRILQGINQTKDITYLTIIPKKNLQLTNIKDMTKGIFVDTSGSTSDKLKSLDISILEVELNICSMIEFDYIIGWNTTSFIYENISMIESNGTTNPESIFQNNLTKDIFNKCDLIVFITDGQIEQKNITKFSSYIKNNLNKKLIICIIIQENIEDHSKVNISVIAPLMFASNVLCLLYDGNIFSTIYSKGLIKKSYPIYTNIINLKDIFNNNIEIYENFIIKNDFIILDENLNEFILFNFDKFICLNDLDQMILINENQWKIIIQYGKINNKLDELKYFVSKMKINSNHSDYQTILKQFDLQLINEENIFNNKILLLKENNQEILKFEKQFKHISNDINQQKINYINENIYLTPNYWNHILDLIYQQEMASYSIKHFIFD